MTNTDKPLPEKLDQILGFGYDDPTFIHDIHVLIGEQRVSEARDALLAAFAGELRAIMSDRPDKYVRMNSDCLEGYKIAIDTIIRNAKERGLL